jgi:hypothetical protein
MDEYFDYEAQLPLNYTPQKSIMYKLMVFSNFIPLIMDRITMDTSVSTKYKEVEELQEVKIEY